MIDDDTAKVLHDQLVALARNLLVAGGAALGSAAIAKGVVDQATWGVLWAAASGVILSLCGIAWSIIDKKWRAVKTEAEAQTREHNAANVGVQIADATKGKTQPLTPTEVQDAIAAAKT